MDVQQFYDESLAHASYAIYSDGEVAVVDPARNPKPYYDYAEQKNGQIVAVFETHPHADFVSSHAQIAEETGATIYVSKKVGADYPHQPFDEGGSVQVGAVTFRSLNTPGHSPDSISIVLIDENGKQRAVFTGDTLFVGDVGRPDLRENVGQEKSERKEMARQLYHSTREKLMTLDKAAKVYPAHGAGSLCGKNLSDKRSSTIQQELQDNPSLQDMSEDDFVDQLLEDLPFAPSYFGYDVEMNRKGAPKIEESVKAIPQIEAAERDDSVLLIDTRPEEDFRSGHLPGAINIPHREGRFETWLGAIVAPGEPFYLLTQADNEFEEVLYKVAKIGYESAVKGIMRHPTDDSALVETPEIDKQDFQTHRSKYAVIDVRTASEHKEEPFLEEAGNIPLSEIRDRVNELPADQPVVMHCNTGYRSSAAVSIVQKLRDDVNIFDMGPWIEEWQPKPAHK